MVSEIDAHINDDRFVDVVVEEFMKSDTTRRNKVKKKE
jgi:hypothetical protein